MRIGVFADSHVSVNRFDPASWHNPYRLRDSAARLERALAHPLLADAEVIVGLGDLVHFGDRESLIRVIEIVAGRGLPAVLLSGNHDVIEDGVRLEEVVERADTGLIAAPLGPTPPSTLAVLEKVGITVICHEVVETWPTPQRPFRVVGRTLADGTSASHLVLTHFPVLSLRRRAESANLLYSGHLADLADPAGLELPAGPSVVLSGHLHLRGVTVEGTTLQIVFAALVEDPFDVALVDLGIGSRGDLEVSYRCASVHPSEAARVPVLDPPSDNWCFTGSSTEQGWTRG